MHLEFSAWQATSNEELEELIAKGLSEERSLLVDMLVHLNILFRRNLYAMRGYTSLNDYLIGRFGMSKQQAFMRAAVARVIPEHPRLLDMLELGETCLSHLATIASRLTPANSQLLYNAAATMTKHELEAFVPKVAPDGSITPGIETITLTIRCRPQYADLLDEVRALISTNDPDVNQGEALGRALAFYLEKNHPSAKAQRAQKRAERKARAVEKSLAKLDDGWDERRGHPQAVAISLREREKAQMPSLSADLPEGSGEDGRPQHESPTYHRRPIAA